MSDAVFELGNGLQIDAENPEKHSKPEKCGFCGVLYYYGDHFCIDKIRRSKAFERAMKGHYDDEQEK